MCVCAIGRTKPENTRQAFGCDGSFVCGAVRRRGGGGLKVVDFDYPRKRIYWRIKIKNIEFINRAPFGTYRRWIRYFSYYGSFVTSQCLDHSRIIINVHNSFTCTRVFYLYTYLICLFCFGQFVRQPCVENRNETFPDPIINQLNAWSRCYRINSRLRCPHDRHRSSIVNHYCYC